MNRHALIALGLIFVGHPAFASTSTLYTNSTSVGIGTTAPLSTLSVSGNLALGAYGGGANTTAAPSNGLIVSGNVGIGTTSPGAALEVNGTAEVDTGGFFKGQIGSLTGPGVIVDAPGGLYGRVQAYNFTGPATSSLALNPSGGNVGIGITTPGYSLDVEGIGGTTGRFLSNTSSLNYLDVQNSNAGTSGNGSIIRLITENAGGTGSVSTDFIHYADGATYINNNETAAFAYTAFQVGSSERMRITSNGSVGIGTAGPSQTLDVRGLIAGNGLVSNGTTFTIASGCGSGGSAPSSLIGGATTGSFVANTTICAPVINLPTAPNGWWCDAIDVTHPADVFTLTAKSTTSCTLSATVTSADVIVFHAEAY